MRVAGIDHVVLRSANVARLVEFYETVLDCRVEKRQPHVGLTQLRAGEALIDIVDVDGAIGRAGGRPPGEEGRNMDHFCLRIEAWDADAIRRHLGAHGVTAGPVEQRYGAGGDGPSIYIQDPDGNGVELKAANRRGE